jgi:hypothetical protein
MSDQPTPIRWHPFPWIIVALTLMTSVSRFEDTGSPGYDWTSAILDTALAVTINWLVAAGIVLAWRAIRRRFRRADTEQ